MELEKVELTYKQLYELFGEGEHEIPYPVTDNLYIKTPTGFSKINNVVCKNNHPVIRIDFENNHSFECSENHLFSCNGSPISANDALFVDTLSDKLKVIEKTPLNIETVYDISIDSPHWYIANDKNNIIHHNTFFTLGIVKRFLEDNPTGGVIYYDTESAITKAMMDSHGIDTSRVIISEPDTIQKFRTHALKTLEIYQKQPEKIRPRLMMVLDSLGMLSTTKEVEDTQDGKETRDMTKAQVIKATFRVLTLKLAKVKVPLVVTNHVFSIIGEYLPRKEMGGGNGLRYSASSIAMLSKKKDKDGTDIVGNIITVKMDKSRLSKENCKVDVRLSYETGLDRYYGLIEFAEKHDVIKRVGNRYEFPDGTKVFRKEIEKNPEKYFDQAMLEKLEVFAKQEFSYGSHRTENDEEEIEEIEEE